VVEEAHFPNRLMRFFLSSVYAQALLEHCPSIASVYAKVMLKINEYVFSLFLLNEILKIKEARFVPV